MSEKVTDDLNFLFDYCKSYNDFEHYNKPRTIPNDKTYLT